MPESTFIERQFTSGKGDVLARFDRPYLAPGGEYRCRWYLRFPDRERSFEAAGIDGVQALLLAMQTVHTELTESDEYKDGALTHLGNRDLGLPPAFDLS
jgi:hypothetical protein